MLRRDKTVSAAPDKVTTVIGRSAHVRGTITGEGSLRIDGRMEGEVEVAGDVYVGESATVHAVVKGRNVTIAGEVHGNVLAEERLELTPTGKLFGDIQARLLSIAEGAVFQGESRWPGTGGPGGVRNLAAEA